MKLLDTVGITGASAFLMAMMLDFCDFTVVSNLSLVISGLCAAVVFAVSIADARRSTRKRKRR